MSYRRERIRSAHRRRHTRRLSRSTEAVIDESQTNNPEAMSRIVDGNSQSESRKAFPASASANLCPPSAVRNFLHANRHVLQFRDGNTTSLQRNSRKRYAETQATH